MQQFADEKQTQTKNAFSIRAADANNFRALIASMSQDLAASTMSRKPMPGTTANAGEAATADTAAANQSAAQASQQAPLNPANLEKHTQAMSKVHQRSSSKSGQAPAAPTTTQPPFQFGQKSPTGQPTYFNKPAVTQETLNPPPPARKKAKTAHQQQAASPAIPQSGPSPQVKAPSPEARRQPQPEQPKAPSRPLFVCPDAQCDMHNTGFPTKEALDAHHYEEHVRPYEDPMKYMEETVAEALGLDIHGKRDSKVGAADASQSGSAAMKTTGSRQGQQTLGKLDPASTPMSQTASMGRQASAQGVKAGASGSGKQAQVKAEGTPKPTMKQEPVQPQQPTAEDPWINSTVDPAALMATFAALQPMINGHLSSFSPYRSRTPPNDTPESSKDSGVSEPNSDISERAQLDIDLRFAPLDLDANTDLLVGLDAFSMGPNDATLADGGSDLAMLWDELDNDFSKLDHTKPFELDTSLYAMHCS